MTSRVASDLRGPDSSLASSPPGAAIDLGDWPSYLSLKTLSGKSVYFLVVRFTLLAMLSGYAWLHGTPTMFSLALAAFVVDLLHTALQIYIQIRGLGLQGWVKRLVAGDLDYRLEAKGADEIAMYCRVLEALRQSLIRSRDLEAAQRALSAELRDKNDALQGTLDQLHATQDQIISREKLAELGELSAGVAHEIRNPLQFVRNFAESSISLSKELAELLSDRDKLTSEETFSDITDIGADLAENMSRIKNHSDRANRIVSDMLSLGRDAAPEFRDVDLNRLVVEQAMLAYHAVSARLPGFNLAIERDLDEAAGTIHAVPVDLGRVVINLVTNACQAVQAKHDAGVDFSPVLHLSTRRTDEGVDLVVRDNGVGMTPETMEKMFTPFFTTRKGAEGTGLGMSLSHDIVRGHGGTIVPASVEGEYTEMTVSLPDRASTPSPPSA